MSSRPHAGTNVHCPPKSVELHVVVQSLRSLARRAERLPSRAEQQRAAQLQRQLVEELERAWVGSSEDLGLLLELLTTEPTETNRDSWRLALWVAVDLIESTQPSIGGAAPSDEVRRVH